MEESLDLQRIKDPKYKAIKITTVKDKKPFVFISYRSLSWKWMVDVVSNLQTKYGLRVYFDKDFKTGTEIWLKQFDENMYCGYCKAMLCFFDENYVKSYATLIELMHAKMKRSPIRNSIFSINTHIDWNKVFSDYEDTGLKGGKKAERNRFNKDFDIINEKLYNKEPGAYYDPDTEVLRVSDCAHIMHIIQPENERYYEDCPEFYEEYIVKPLWENCKEVFDKDLDLIFGNSENIEEIKASEPVAQPEVSAAPESDGQTYHIGGEGRRYDAYYRKNADGTYTVLKGSRIWFADDHKWITKKLWDEYKDQIVDHVLQCDIEGLKRSTAGKLITGQSTNGHELDDEKKRIQSAPDKPPEPIVQPEVSAAPKPDAQTYHIGGDDRRYDAYYRKNADGTYTVLKGSRIWFADDHKWITKKLWDEYEDQIVDHVLQCDIEGLKRSTAGGLIKGQSTNGRELDDEKKRIQSAPERVMSTGSRKGDENEGLPV